MGQVLVLGERHICRVVQANLSIAGHDCVLAYTMDQAQLCLATAHFDLAIVDSELGGYEVLTSIREAELPTKVIMWVAEDREEEYRSRPHQPDQYLTHGVERSFWL